MSALLAVVAFSAFAAPKKEKSGVEEATRVYLYGVALNFNDSVVYMTDLQYLDGVVINKDGSLNNYSSYSLQLKNYLEITLGEENQTCAVIYSPKKKSLEKRIIKMRKKIQLGDGKQLRRVGADAFVFRKE